MKLLKNRYLRMFLTLYLIYGTYNSIRPLWSGESFDLNEILSKTLVYSLVVVGLMWFFDWVKPPPKKEDT